MASQTWAYDGEFEEQTPVELQLTQAALPSQQNSLLLRLARARSSSEIQKEHEATDHVWNHRYWLRREAFDIANRMLGLDIEAIDVDVPEISKQTVGTYDIVLFLGVLRPALAIAVYRALLADVSFHELYSKSTMI